MIVTEMNAYMLRLRRECEIGDPETYFEKIGHPYVLTPHGKLLRPSLLHLVDRNEE